MAILLERGLPAPDGKDVQHYPEGVLFHSYHAFESALRGIFRRFEPQRDFPYSHADKIGDALDLLKQANERLATRGRALVTKFHRDDCLYVSSNRGRVVKPSDRYTHEYASRLRLSVKAYVEDLASYALSDDTHGKKKKAFRSGAE